MNYYFDCETTGKNPYHCEIITGYIRCNETGDALEIESQVDKWSEDAAKIHGIKYSTMLTYPSKIDAWDRVLKYFGNDRNINLIVYANPQTELGWLLYDVVAFKMHVMNHLQVNKESHMPFYVAGESVHSLAKACHNLGLFEAIKKEGSNRYSFTQENVYMALFGTKYNAHNAKSDVEAMIRIYDKLNQLKKDGIRNSGQLELI